MSSTNPTAQEFESACREYAAIERIPQSKLASQGSRVVMRREVEERTGVSFHEYTCQLADEQGYSVGDDD